MMKSTIIIAPHADDEIIGCYNILKTHPVEAVLYGSKIAVKEAEETAKYFEFMPLFAEVLLRKYIKKKYLFFFPDPYFEAHPEHRAWGGMGERLLRQGEDIIFYSTNMNAPYIHEVSYPETKHFCLDTHYPEKKSLWEYDHKYFLFEGYNKWIMKWED